MRHPYLVHRSSADYGNDKKDGSHLNAYDKSSLDIPQAMIQLIGSNACGLHDCWHRDQGDLQESLGARHDVSSWNVWFSIPELAEGGEDAYECRNEEVEPLSVDREYRSVRDDYLQDSQSDQPWQADVSVNREDP